MKVLVTGGAGFIGSNMVDRLLLEGHDVVIYDNLSSGIIEFIEKARQSAHCTFVQNDVLDAEALKKAMYGCELVFHFAANADVRFGTQDTFRDLQQNTIATYNVLEAMRFNGCKKIVFSSTGSIYGEASIIPTPENCPFPLQTSLYGASKLAGEGLIEAYCEGFGMQSWIFRFVSILGERYTHGHVFDFYKKLLAKAETITVLGDGTQKKSYLYVQDCLDAILFTIQHSQEKINLFNLGTDEYVQVNDSLDLITKHLELKPQRQYTGGTRGWIGDNPFIYLDCTKVFNLGIRPKFSIREGIVKTLQWLEQNHWILERRT